MYVSLRSKASRANASSTDNLSMSGDQSRVDSTSNKRFSRKQTANNQSNRISRTPRGSEASFKATFEIYDLQQQTKKPTQTVTNFKQNDQLYLRLSPTPIKNKNYAPIPSTDRATQSSNTRERTYCESMNHIFESPLQRKSQFDHLQAEIQLKSAEIMLLQDQNMRLKRDLANKQSQYLKMKNNVQKEHQKVVQTLKEQIDSLKKQLLIKNEEIRNFKKTEAALTREIKGVKYEKTMLEKQLDEIYKKKLTKEMRDLMSYREQSLQLQVEDLREQIRRQKTEKQKQMQTKLDQLSYETLEKNSNVKKLQIHSHVLNKKVVDIEEELRYKQEQFGKCLNNIQQTNQALVTQLKRTRKENIKLQRLNLLSKQNNRTQVSNFSPESNTLSLSLSSVNSRIQTASLY